MFDEHLVVELQQVHTPLQAKHLAEERRFDHHLITPIASHTLLYTLSKGATDVVTLHFTIFLQVAQIGSQSLEGIAAHEGGITLGVWYFLLAMVHLFVEQLTRQITKHRRSGVFHRRQFIDEVQIGVMRIFLEAIGYRRHIQQIIRP